MIKRISISKAVIVVTLVNFLSAEAFRLGSSGTLKTLYHKNFLSSSQDQGDLNPYHAKKNSADVDDGKLVTIEPRKSYDTFGNLNHKIKKNWTCYSGLLYFNLSVLEY